MVMTLAQLEELGASRPAEEWTSRIHEAASDDVAMIVYTSGTTGPPKGAMLTHANLLAVADATAEVYSGSDRDEVLSYLPLCHIAERLVSGINAVNLGYVVNFGEGGDTFLTDMQEAQPTFFLGVPRVWEKMMAGVQIRLADASWVKRTVAKFWLARGAKLARKRMAGGLGPVDRVVYGLG